MNEMQNEQIIIIHHTLTHTQPIYETKKKCWGKSDEMKKSSVKKIKLENQAQNDDDDDDLMMIMTTTTTTTK